jgi:hypothetical protein
MKIMFVADGRSPIALNWIDHFIQSDHEVHLASSFPCQPVPGLASLKVIPLAMSGIYGRSLERNTGRGRFLRKIIPVSLRTHIRRLVAPSSFPRAAHAIIDLMLSIGPDLIHAMRIPFEGMVASQAVEEIRNANPGKTKVPLLISVWGNDFTLHAQSSSQMASFTRRALVTCDALHTDCHRDLILAQDFGFDSTKSSIVYLAARNQRAHLKHPMVTPKRFQ